MGKDVVNRVWKIFSFFGVTRVVQRTEGKRKEGLVRSINSAIQWHSFQWGEKIEITRRSLPGCSTALSSSCSKRNVLERRKNQCVFYGSVSSFASQSGVGHIIVAFSCVFVVSVTFSEKENVYESRERAPLSPLTDDGRLDSLTVGRVEMNFCVEFGRSPGHRRLISLRNDHRDGFYVTEKRMTEN